MTHRFADGRVERRDSPIEGREPFALQGRPEQLDFAAEPAGTAFQPEASAIGEGGCAVLCALALGWWLAGDRRKSAVGLVVTLVRAMIARGWVKQDMTVADWEEAVNRCYDGGLVRYLGAVSGDYPDHPGVVCVDEWAHRVGPHTYRHFTLDCSARNRAVLQYDPLGSYEPGLSRTRAFGELVGRRAFLVR